MDVEPNGEEDAKRQKKKRDCEKRKKKDKEKACREYSLLLDWTRREQDGKQGYPNAAWQKANANREGKPSLGFFSSFSPLFFSLPSLPSHNLQTLKIHHQVPRARAHPVPPVIHGAAKVGRPARVHAHADRLVLDAPEKVRHFAQLVPARDLVQVPHPQRVSDALNLDAEVRPAGVVRRQRRRGPVGAVRGRYDRGRVAGAFAELEADFDPFGGGRGL